MTEMVGVVADNQPPRSVGTRCFGRAVRGIDVRVVNDNDQKVPQDSVGELIFCPPSQRPALRSFTRFLRQAPTLAARPISST
ncbi:MAG: hypothetical protein J2P47_06275 [Acetobacteraceae bacterium]|nr:hypothetical protein [Acetobacteraceae bacterium]